MAVPSSPWFRFHNGKEIQVPNASIYDGDVLVHVEGNEERCVTPAPSRRDRAAPTVGACRLRRPEKDGRSTAKPQLERIFGSPTGDGREPRVEGAVPGCALGSLLQTGVRFQTKRTLEQTSPNDRV
jgi:hypothetical protein